MYFLQSVAGGRGESGGGGGGVIYRGLAGKGIVTMYPKIMFLSNTIQLGRC